MEKYMEYIRVKMVLLGKNKESNSSGYTKTGYYFSS